MRLNIAARKSDLARIQAYNVGAAIKAVFPKCEIHFSFRESLGDKNLVDPLWKMPEKGVFTEDFYQDLVSGQVDMVVHSWKDLPTEIRAETEIVATLPRADMRDLLLMRKDMWARAQTTKTLRLFSSSPRRAYNLKPFLQAVLPVELTSLDFESVRGNVPTRIEKLMAATSVHGLIVAKAAIDRLLSAEESEFAAMQTRVRHWLKETLVMVLPLSENPTAAAQGALAVEIVRGRADLRECLGRINCPATYRAVVKERAILAGYGGGCHQKVGVSVLPRPQGEYLFVKALTDQGEVVNRLEFHAATPVVMTKTTPDKIFPLKPAESSWFIREPVDVELEAGPLWIAKEEALPQTVTLPHDRLVWTSGIDSWKKLARRHVWVSGCSESLGESEDPRLDLLLSYERPWVKLTHVDGHNTPGFKIQGTYKLVPKNGPPDLRGKTHFYWMSASSFRRAREMFPQEMAAGFHGCGPGNTYALIAALMNEAAVMSRGQLNIFASHADWLERVLK